MWALVMKEFRQVRRDHRTLAMLIVLPVPMLVVFGYAASFDVKEIRTAVLGPGAAEVAGTLPPDSRWWRWTLRETGPKPSRS